MKTRGLQPRLLYPARISIKMEGQIRSFQDKRSLKSIPTPNQLCKRWEKVCFKNKKKNSERYWNTVTKKMAMNKYLSIITLKINGSNAPIKRHRIVEWIRKHDLHI